MRQNEISYQMIAGAVAAAEAAGFVIMEMYQKQNRMPVSIKADLSPVTAADIESHHLLTHRLALLDAKIPVVSEEDQGSLKHLSTKGRFWLIDPLDGTKEFINKTGEFAVNVALIEDARPVLGVVHMPVSGVTYWGGMGHGAFKKCYWKSVPINVTPFQKDRLLRVTTSRSHLDEETKNFVRLLGETSLVVAGSALKPCLVAEGAADVYPRMSPTCQWDIAAPQAVLEAAGGYVTSLRGETLVYGGPDVLNPHFVASSIPLVDLVSQKMAHPLEAGVVAHV